MENREAVPLNQAQMNMRAATFILFIVRRVLKLKRPKRSRNAVLGSSMFLTAVGWDMQTHDWRRKAKSSAEGGSRTAVEAQ